MGLVRYKTAEMATLDSITQLDFSHTRCPHLPFDQGHNISVFVCLSLAPWQAHLITLGTQNERNVCCVSLNITCSEGSA